MLKEMDYVYAVYEEHSFSKAAKKLFISQPALSNMVKKAEDEIGIPIFDRSSVPLGVTKEGQHYIKAVKEIRGIQNNIFEYMRDQKRDHGGELSIGGSSYFCSFIFPEMIAHFHEHYPDVAISLQEDNIDHLRRDLEDENVNLILETADLSSDENADSYFYKNERILLAVPGVFEICRKLEPYRISRDMLDAGSLDRAPCIPLSELRNVPFIQMKPGNDMYERSLEICRHAGFEMKAAIYVDQVMTALNIASEGTGALFFRADILKHLQESDKLVYYRIDDPLCVREIHWFVKKGRYLSRAVREFMRIANHI